MSPWYESQLALGFTILLQKSLYRSMLSCLRCLRILYSVVARLLCCSSLPPGVVYVCFRTVIYSSSVKSTANHSMKGLPELCWQLDKSIGTHYRALTFLQRVHAVTDARNPLNDNLDGWNPLVVSVQLCVRRKCVTITTTIARVISSTTSSSVKCFGGQCEKDDVSREKEGNLH
jgi:hypothetical protein